MLYASFAPLPFALVLVSLALLPAVAPHLWENPLQRFVYFVLLATPTTVMLGLHQPHVLMESVTEYVAFMALLMGLYGVAGGIVLRGNLPRGSKTNVALLGLGTLLASLLGTTGASMLLIRPYLAGQKGRRYQAHTVVFFIFMVSNVGGLLLPLGDPPLFLGYLRGVPFLWTLQLWPKWLLANSLLLVTFAGIDKWAYKREPYASVTPPQTPLSLAGAHNLAWFAALLILVAAGPSLHLGPWLQSAALLLVLAGSYATTAQKTYQQNGVTLAPMVEVGTVFAAIFLTMPPALEALTAWAPKLGALSAETYYWATGSLSAVLDNAPCYLTFATLAAAQVGVSHDSLLALAHSALGEPLLRSVALGSVTMGAMTYIGNGPNLMVRAVAQENGVTPPSFIGYLAWSLGILLPLLALVRVVLPG